MKIYLMSLAAGILVGIVYSLLNVRSPAPPIVALIGLLGILVGEQVLPLVRTVWKKEPAALSWLHEVKPHMFGHLPRGRRPEAPTLDTVTKAKSEEARSKAGNA